MTKKLRFHQDLVLVPGVEGVFSGVTSDNEFTIIKHDIYMSQPRSQVLLKMPVDMVIEFLNHAKKVNKG